LTYDEFAFENIKAQICKIIQVVLDIQNEIRLNAVLFKFKSISLDLLSRHSDLGHSSEQASEFKDNISYKSETESMQIQPESVQELPQKFSPDIQSLSSNFNKIFEDSFYISL